MKIAYPRDLIVINGVMVTKSGVKPGRVLIENGLIRSTEESIEVRDSDNVLDARGGMIFPGFIDLHFYGCLSKAIRDPETVKSDLAVFARALPQWGVTSFLISPAGVSHSHRMELLSALGEAIPLEREGARVLGIHLEGPFLNKDYRGGFPLNSLELPDPGRMKQYIEAGQGWVKIVTLAPELDGALEVADQLREAGIVASLGHSNAEYGLAKQALTSRFQVVTHLYNAMRPFHHRDPGLLGAIFEEAKSAMIICDGLHVHPSAVQMAVKMLSPERVILCTDAIPGTGMGDGSFLLYGQTIIVKDHLAYLENGTIAGSTLTMDRAVRNLRDFFHLDYYDLALCSSRNAANLLRRNDLGNIDLQAKGDLVIFDKDLQLQATIIHGKICFNRSDI